MLPIHRAFGVGSRPCDGTRLRLPHLLRLRLGRRALRERRLALPPRCASFTGYSLHAGVGFKASDAGLERLSRYILRPPLAKDRLQRREDERLFRVDCFACPGCGGPLTLRCMLLNPPATRRILAGLRRATGPPWPRPRGRRPEGVTTRDRGRSRARGTENVSFRAPFTRWARPDGTGGGVDGGEVQVRGCGSVGFIFPIRR